MKDHGLKDFQTLTRLVYSESDRQISKWGIQNRSPFEWLAHTTEELGELARAISENYYRGAPPGEVVKEAIQTATLVLKIAEMFLHEVEENKEGKTNGIK
ncbi:MAG: hypothetical protein O8C67_02045 [Candidatus Methanoperedens sp.]|nr:hypothetical protein [Candidatus Methanoperedens sp.]